MRMRHTILSNENDVRYCFVRFYHEININLMHNRLYHLSFADKLETQVLRACVQKDLKAKSVKYLKLKLWLVSIIITYYYYS